MVDKQAAVLAINDSFYLMGWYFLGLIQLLLIGRKRTGSFPKEGGHIVVSME